MTPARFAQDALVVGLVAIAGWQLLARLGVRRAVAVRLAMRLGDRPLPRALRPLRVWAQRAAPAVNTGCGSGCSACQRCETAAVPVPAPEVASRGTVVSLAQLRRNREN
jgi:hypothetical protein